MTIEDLEAYAEELKTSIDFEYSTLTSYTKMQDAYALSIFDSQSTISGLDIEINTNTIVYNAAVARKTQLDTEIAAIDVYIADQVSTMSGLDIEITDTDDLISSLRGESSTLTLELEASDLKFKEDAQNYSSLVYTYLAKQAAYDENVSSIRGESTLLESAKVMEAESYAVYKSTFDSYVDLSREVSTLIDQSFTIQSKLSEYRTIETNAETNLISTVNAITSISSLYEASLITQQHNQALSTLAAATTAYTAADGLLQEATRVLEEAPGDTTRQQAKSLAEEQVRRKRTEQIAAEEVVPRIAESRGLAENAAYEALLKSYNNTIDLESRNVSTFSARRMTAENELNSYSTTYEQSLIDIRTLTENIKTFSTFYESSLTGAATLESNARTYDSTISTNQSFVSIYTQLILAETGKYESSLSSFQGYSTIKFDETSSFNSYAEQLQAVSTLFESTNSAVLRLTSDFSTRRTEAESTFTALMAESTTFESVFIQQEVFQALIEQSLVQQELAALQYQETYARAKRIAVGEAYNVAILEEVQNVSSLNGLARASAGPDAPIQLRSVNMNSELIQQASQRIQTLNAFINSYTDIYSVYDAQIQNMSSLSTAVGNKQTAVNTLAQRNEALLDQIYKSTTGSRSMVPDSAVITAYNQGNAAFRTRLGEADTARGKVQTARDSINTIIQTYRQTYESIFTPTERLEHETTISSFLIAGYQQASLQPTPTS